MHRKFLVLSIFVICVVISIIAFVIFNNYRNSTEELTFTFKNVHGVEIYELSDHTEGENEGLISKVTASGEVVKLKKGLSYSVAYKGNEGFASGEIGFDIPGDKKTIDINPYYSESRLSSMLDDELNSIQSVLISTYPTTIGSYEIQRGKLYHWGEWYGTTLRYIGDNGYNADTLRGILKKKNGVWQIETNPPDITLSKFSYPDIPLDILSNVNNFQQTPLLEKFTTGQ